MGHILIKDHRIFLLHSLIGCSLIILLASVKIPFVPVPFTLQTLAILIIATTQTPEQALSSSLLYLLCGSIGLPVFAGGISNPFWMLSPLAGYLISFPIAAFVIAKLYTTIPTLFAFFIGHIIIYMLGFIGLCPTLGAKTALLKGVVIFLPSALIKIALADIFTKIYQRKNGL